LVDPETLIERTGYAEARVLGRDHVLALDDRESNLVLHTPTGELRLDKPSPHAGPGALKAAPRAASDQTAALLSPVLWHTSQHHDKSFPASTRC